MPFTAGGTDDRNSHETSLRDIEERLKKLPYTGMIRVQITDAAGLDSGGWKQLVREISSWLATCPSEGHRWRRDDIRVDMMAVGGKRLDIVTYDPIHRIVTPASVAENFEAKAKRYGILQHPLIVAAVKHPSAEIHDRDIEDVLLGQPAYVSRETRDGRVVGLTCRLPGGVLTTRAEISAALWISPYSRPTPRVQVWANKTAQYPVSEDLIEALSQATL